MSRPKTGTELEALRRQQIDLARRIKVAEARDRERQKANQVRREQLAGRAVLDYLDAHAGSATALAIMAVIDAAPLRPADRALFAAVLAPVAPSAGPGSAETTSSGNTAQAAA